MVSLFLAGAVSSAAYGATSGNDSANAGDGYQWAEWSMSNKWIGLQASAYSAMSNSSCIDAFLDWKTGDGGHYDARTVRTCEPGDYLYSYDWSGPSISGLSDLNLADRRWNEPSSAWSRAGVVDMQKGAGIEMSDSYSGGTFQVHHQEKFAGAPGSLSAYVDHIPRTCVDKYALVLTLYDDGHYNGCKNYPADSAS